MAMPSGSSGQSSTRFGPVIVDSLTDTGDAAMGCNSSMPCSDTPCAQSEDSSGKEAFAKTSAVAEGGD